MKVKFKSPRGSTRLLYVRPARQEERADMNNLLYVVTVRLKEKLPSSILSRAPPPPAKNPYLTSDRKATIGEGGIVNSADREAFASFGEEKWRAKFLLKRSIDLDEVSASFIVVAGFVVPDPDPTYQAVLDPDPDPDPTRILPFNQAN